MVRPSSKLYWLTTFVVVDGSEVDPGHLCTVSLPTCWDSVCMAAGGQAAALGVKRRPFAAKILKIIDTRQKVSGRGAHNGKS